MSVAGQFVDRNLHSLAPSGSLSELSPHPDDADDLVGQEDICQAEFRLEFSVAFRCRGFDSRNSVQALFCLGNLPVLLHDPADGLSTAGIRWLLVSKEPSSIQDVHTPK